MEVIATVPASKEYRFRNLSLTSLCCQLLLNLSISAAFFLVYSTDGTLLGQIGFYMNSLKTYEQPSISYTNRYMISATLLSGKIVTATNMFTTNQDADLLLNGLDVSQSDFDGDGKPDLLEVRGELLKATGGLQVISLCILLPASQFASLKTKCLRNCLPRSVKFILRKLLKVASPPILLKKW